MKKYIQRNEQGKPGQVWHSNPQCVAIKPDNKVVSAPDSLLQAYGITDQCGLCKAWEERNRLLDNEDDLREFHEILVLGASVVEKEVPRTSLRKELEKRQIRFSLRESKATLTRKLCKCWLREHDYQSLKALTDKAILHWLIRIEVKDRHWPVYYKEMYERSLELQELLQKLLTKPVTLSIS